MSDKNVKVVVADLRRDADDWDRVSTELSAALTTLQTGCSLPYATFDGISHMLGADAAYEAAYDQVAVLLDSGAKETAMIASRLRTTADTMTSTDADAAAAQRR